jgi:hypothetical protein
MGTLTITPNLLSGWTGNANVTAYNAFLTQVLNDLHDAFTPVNDCNFTFSFNYTGAGSGASSTVPYDTTYTYSQIKTAYQGLSNKSSVQTTASANLPGSSPFGSNTIFMAYALEQALGLISTYNGNSTVITINTGGTRDTTVDGTTCAGGQASLYGTLMHEITEALGRSCSIGAFFGSNTNVGTGDLFTWSGAGTRDHTNASGRYFSDDGTLNYGPLNTGGGGSDLGDTTDATAFDAFVNDVLGVAPSRSSSLPLTANNWKTMNLIGWPLSATGLTWAGLSGSIPTISTPPAVTGTLRTGNAISSDTGSWTDTPTSYTYQWKKNGSNIGGATSSSYSPTNTDRDAFFTCGVTAHNAAGDSTESVSNSVGPWLTNTKASPFLR